MEAGQDLVQDKGLTPEEIAEATAIYSVEIPEDQVEEFLADAGDDLIDLGYCKTEEEANKKFEELL